MSRRDLLSALDSLIRVVDNTDSLDNVRNGSVLARARAVAQRAAQGHTTPVPWTPFVEAQPMRNAAAVGMIREIMPSIGAAEAETLLEQEARNNRLFVNSRYQVAMRECGGTTVHLSIKRIDQTEVHDWRDLQRIKDELVGPECEAVELYPANSRLVDTANQYHLWCSHDPAFRFPLGFPAGLVVDEVGGGAHQRRRESSG
jgi:hypothetical protein